MGLLCYVFVRKRENVCEKYLLCVFSYYLDGYQEEGMKIFTWQKGIYFYI